MRKPKSEWIANLCKPEEHEFRAKSLCRSASYRALLEEAGVAFDLGDQPKPLGLSFGKASERAWNGPSFFKEVPLFEQAEYLITLNPYGTNRPRFRAGGKDARRLRDGFAATNPEE